MFVQQNSIKSVTAFKGQAGLSPWELFLYNLKMELHAVTLRGHLLISLEIFYGGIVGEKKK